MKNTELGQLGESLAADHLRKKGHTILVQNFRRQRSEIDIISTVGNTLVITEVKTRRALRYGRPSLAVSFRKQRQLILAANRYVCEKKDDREIRFDVISVVLCADQTIIEHLENAFYPIHQS